MATEPAFCFSQQAKVLEDMLQEQSSSQLELVQAVTL
jgi:hypothetical protein